MKIISKDILYVWIPPIVASGLVLNSILGLRLKTTMNSDNFVKHNDNDNSNHNK